MNLFTKTALAVIFGLMVACQSFELKEEKAITQLAIDSINPYQEDSAEKQRLKEYYASLIEPVQKELEGYRIKLFYTEYDEDKNGLSNPAQMEVYKDGQLVFKDSFKADAALYVESVGHHDLSGNKWFFCVRYGTEASDYTQGIRYYVTNLEGKFKLIKEFWTSSTDFAYRDVETIFPDDAHGVANQLLFVESLHFIDQEDGTKPDPSKYDTTHVGFEGDEFNVKKLTNRLDPEKAN